MSVGRKAGLVVCLRSASGIEVVEPLRHSPLQAVTDNRLAFKWQTLLTFLPVILQQAALCFIQLHTTSLTRTA